MKKFKLLIRRLKNNHTLSKILKHLNSFLHPTQISVTKCFIIFVLVVTLFTATIYFYISKKIYEDSAIADLQYQSLRIEKSLIESFDYSSYLMGYLGDQIKKHDITNLQYIAKLLASFHLNTDSENKIPWNIFSWVNNDRQMVVNSNGGIIKPIDLSDRDYIKASFKQPGKMHLGNPVYGRASRELVVPAGMGIADKNNKYFGVLIFGFKIEKFSDRLWRSMTNDDIAFAIFDYDGEQVITSDGFDYDEKTQKLIDQAIASPAKIGRLTRFTFFGSNDHYGSYKKNDDYSYIIITKYKNSFVIKSFWTKIYVYFFEIFALFFILGLIFYILRLSVLRPIIQLSRASELIALDRDSEVVMPKTRISELMELIEQLQSVEEHKLELIRVKESQERFFANMSHELRTPLNGILNFSSMMEKEMLGEISEDYKEMAVDIKSSGTHLLNLVNDILDFSKMDVGKVKLREERFAILEEVNGAIKIVTSDIESHTDNGVEIIYHIDEGISQFYGDRRMFKQILLNLLSNAAKFTYEGEISLNIYANEENDFVLEVKDSGIGIKQEDIAKLVVEFGQVGDGYSRGKKQGSGLGLFLIKKMTELHQGKFEISSIYGKGTSVRVIFPRVRYS